MPDDVDDYNESLEAFLSAELATRKATRAKGAPCTTCKNPAHVLLNGTITKHCLTCWREDYDSPPASLTDDLKKRGITEK